MKAIETFFAKADRSLRNAKTQGSHTSSSLLSPSQAHKSRPQHDQNKELLSLDQFAAMCSQYIQEYQNKAVY